MTKTNLNAFLQTCDQPISRESTEGKKTLDSLTLAVKDNIMVKDLPVTAGSKILDGHIASYSATVIERLLDAGAQIIGKTNLDEFAMGSSTENSAFGPTLNPWDQTRVPGGSSGGSAAAVADRLAQASLGSDTGGSIRQPAAFCGVTGLKPTYGSVSRYGLIALASSLDVIGPLAPSAETVEEVFAIISGQDPLDQTTVDYTYKPLEQSIDGLKIGLPRELWELYIDPEIKRSVEQHVHFYLEHGAVISDVSLPYLPYALAAYYIILPAEASANLARYDGIRYPHSQPGQTIAEIYKKTRGQGFGAEVKRRILLGSYVLSVGHYDEYYQKAQEVRNLIKRDYDNVFKSVDVLISRTTPTLPFALGSRTQDPLKMYQADLLTVGVNLAGLPAISLPSGFSQSGLPIGSQLIGRPFCENVLLSLAKQYQGETDHHQQQPKGTDG